jgi:hypothetical protein
MSGLFDFLTVANLLIFLLCIIGLYYSINLVIYYYAPTATPFVNMYFLYYIFFVITLLISVACNNYIEMTDSDIDITDISKMVGPVTKEITEGVKGLAEGLKGEGEVGSIGEGLAGEVDGSAAAAG